jgi:hypothetical protein
MSAMMFDSGRISDVVSRSWALRGGWVECLLVFERVKEVGSWMKFEVRLVVDPLSHADRLRTSILQVIQHAYLYL